MNTVHPEESVSLWSATVEMPEFLPLREDVLVDVCVVGGGMAGLSAAYLLMKEGKSVCVLESFELGSGQTARTTAHFSNALDDRYFEIEKIHGRDGARLAFESHTAAIQKVADIVRAENIECDFEYVNGYLFQDDRNTEDTLKNEYEACQRIGMKDVVFADGNSLCFPRQVQLHPLKYLRRLAELISNGGGQIYTHSFAEKFQGGKNSFVKTRDGFNVRCQSIVVATNTPINDLLAIHTKQYAYRSYVLAFEIPKGKIENALYWDTEDPYHYIRLESDTVLIVGGEDHKTGQESHPEQCYQRLERWARQRYDFAGAILYRWSGQVMEPMDALGFLGRNPGDYDNVFVITGDSGNGMTHVTIGAMLITDQIMGRKNDWENLYSPSRISLRATSTFLKENINTAAQYADWVTTKSAESLGDLPFGEGRVFRDGLQLVAAYRNDNGAYHTVSAVCPHLGGVVSWNTVEKSWDCPCHGSRFDCHGKVIEGPAVSDLKSVDYVEPAVLTERVSPVLQTYSADDMSPV
ncbi:MAG: FAD-dependent oxidoreductase [Bdellovibrionaceae bacterium]|nr:FAD-dependent oxidoreductase [Pseudobdellovibrionaceae bacterium]